MHEQLGMRLAAVVLLKLFKRVEFKLTFPHVHYDTIIGMVRNRRNVSIFTVGMQSVHDET